MAVIDSSLKRAKWDNQSSDILPVYCRGIPLLEVESTAMERFIGSSSRWTMTYISGSASTARASDGGFKNVLTARFPMVSVLRTEVRRHPKIEDFRTTPRHSPYPARRIGHRRRGEPALGQALRRGGRRDQLRERHPGAGCAGTEERLRD